MVMVFNATFNNISVISWQLALLLEFETQSCKMFAYYVAIDT
jgi:hypothetical protein